MFERRFTKKLPIRKTSTVSQTNPKLEHCSTLSLCQLERCSIQRDRLVGRLSPKSFWRSEYYGETSDACKEGVGSSSPSLLHHLSLKRPMTNLAPTVGGRYLCLPLPTTIITGHIHSQKGSFHKNWTFQLLFFLFLSGLQLHYFCLKVNLMEPLLTPSQ